MCTSHDSGHRSTFDNTVLGNHNGADNSGYESGYNLDRPSGSLTWNQDFGLNDPVEARDVTELRDNVDLVRDYCCYSHDSYDRSDYDANYDHGFHTSHRGGYDSQYDSGDNIGYDSGYDSSFNYGEDGNYRSTYCNTDRTGHNGSYDGAYDGGYYSNYNSNEDINEDSGHDGTHDGGHDGTHDGEDEFNEHFGDHTGDYGRNYPTEDGSHDSDDESTCPFILVWNGQKLVLENNIIPKSEKFDSETMVDDLYRLENNPVPENGFYKIRISEFENERSIFKDFKLVKVNHPEDVKVGVLNDEIVAYKDVKNASSVKVCDKEVKGLFENSRGGGAQIEFELENKKRSLLVMKGALRSGERRIEKCDEILAEKDNTLEQFTKSAVVAIGLLAAIKGDVAYGYKIQSIYFHLPNQNNKQVEVMHPRERLSHKLIDLSDHISENQKDLQLKLKWTATHKLRPVGMAKRVKKESLEIEEISPEEVIHSKEGEIEAKEISENGVILNPGESMTLNFPQSKAGQKETFLLKSRGYYESL